MNGYMITVSRVECGREQADIKYFVSDTELKTVNKDIGYRIMQGKLERSLSDLDFDHLYLEDNK